MGIETGHTDLIWEAEQDEPPSLDLTAFLNDLFRCLHIEGAECGILVTNDAAMRQYNRTYRGVDLTTDVLSFPMGDMPTPEGGRPLGDIVISLDQANRQAGEIGHGLAEELRFLILHGVLHLLGYDHETDQGEMFALQREIKEKLGRYFQGRTG